MAFRFTVSRFTRARSSLLLTSALVAPLRPRLAPQIVSTTRGYASEPQKSGSSSAVWLGVALVGAAGGYYFYTTSTKPVPAKAPSVPPAPPQVEKKPLDYNEVYKAVAEILEDNDYDDGSFGPILVRLAWHASGTYSKADGSGGSNGATMRFAPESDHGANAGLNVARDLIEKVKAKFPEISYGDLWTLAGVAAIQEMGGPIIPWRPGRQDKASAQDCTPDGRLPDAAQGSDHLRDIFHRMGFNDQEIVALSGAHALGRCHPDRSGFEGPWTNSPTVFTNGFFKELVNQKWIEKKWKGPKQFVDKATGQLMMLPTDLALTKDKEFKKWVDIYAKDEKQFFDDFAKVFQKLLELGVPFKGDEKVYTFTPTNA